MKLLKAIIPVTLILILFNAASSQAAQASNKEIDWFWFFYEYTNDVKTETVVYRPFFLEADSGDKMFQASLMPLLFWRYKSEREDITKGFFGLYESDNYSHKREGDDYDSGLFPLYLYGSGDTAKDRYLFIYPIGGNIKGKFGYDRISPWVFPGVALFFLYPPSAIVSWQTLFWTLASLIPVYTEFDMREYHGKAIFWPFIKWGEGGNLYDFRIFPFYAHNYKKGWYESYNWLLIFNYREMYYSNDTRYTFFIFPFYGSKWSDSGDMSAHVILWPFFSWGHDDRTGDSSYNLPWPLVQIRDCREPYVRSRIFFPFYGRYNYGSKETFFVTPLYFRMKKETEAYKSEEHFSAIIIWWFKRDYRVTDEYYGNSWRYFKFWPLIQVEWNDRDMFSMNILSLLPFRDTFGYEKLYQPFWTLFEYRRKTGGEKHLGILLRTYYQVWSDDMFKMKIPLLVTYDRQGDSIREFSFLLSSFGYEKDKDGSYIKFLWIPLKIGDGDPGLAGVDDDRNFYGEPEDPFETAVKYAGFNPEHAELYDRSLDGNCFVRANLF